MSSEIKKNLVKITKKLNVKFQLNGRFISHEEVFSDDGLLPALSRRADQLSSLCLGYGIGVSFEEVEKTLLGVKVTFDEVTPNALRYMCIIDVVSELINVSPDRENIALDELMYD